MFELPEEIEEYSNELGDRINSNRIYQTKAKDWGEDFNGSILLHAKKDENMCKDIHIRLNLERGHCVGVELGDDARNSENGFVYRGDYTDWRELISNQSKQMLRDGTFEVEGDIETFVEFAHAHFRLASIAQQIPTKFTQ